METPEGAIQIAIPILCDADTLRPWTRTRMAALWCQEEFARTGRWPAVKCVMLNCDVGQGSAHRALLAAGGCGAKARERYLNSTMEKIV